MVSRAISYARFSSSSQASGSSLERQLKLTRDYCEQHGLLLDESLTDEGLSAYKDDHTARGALGRFMQAIELDRVDRGTYLIVEHLDRLSRAAVRPALTQFLRIIDAGVKIVTLFDGRTYEDSSESIEIDLIIAILTMSEAHKSSRDKALRIAEAWATKRSKPGLLTTMRPAWLDVSADGASFVENKARADIVRRIFRDAAAGLGSWTIANTLNREGVPTLTGDRKHRAKLPGGKPNPKAGQSVANGWNKSRIVRIINSDAPLGWFQPHRRDGKKSVRVGDPRQNYYPAVIDQVTAQKARAQIASRTFAGQGAGRRGEVISNLFTGVIKCECGASMFLSNRQPKKNCWGRLRCSAAYRKASDCPNRRGIDYDKFERSFIEHFTVVRELTALRTPRNESREIADSLAEKRAEARRLKANFTEMTETFGDGALPLIAARIKEMAQRHQTVLEEVTLLERRLRAAQGVDRDDSDQERTWINEHLNADDPAVRRVARAELATVIRNRYREGIICLADRKVLLGKLSSIGGPLESAFGLDENFNAALFMGVGTEMIAIVSLKAFSDAVRVAHEHREHDEGLDINFVADHPEYLALRRPTRFCIQVRRLA